MSGGFGPAPVLDFDGTIARLPVSWSELRSTLNIDRIDDLWSIDDTKGWATVAAAEEEAALRAEPVARVIELLGAVRGFAVLSSNGDGAIRCFLDREPALSERVRRVVGRDSLGGPKTDFTVFTRGFSSCVEATAADRGDSPVVYVGDMDYELDFARRLGAVTIDARALTAPL